MAVTDIVTGNIYYSTSTFTNQAATATDPSTIEFIYESNNAPGTKTILTYAGAGTPAVGVIARIATGVYQVQLDTTDMWGFFTRQWVSTGTAQAASTIATIAISASL